jgi:hypothetical protein
MPADTTHPHGEVFLDARGEGRALRLTWHHEADVVVLSLWRDRICSGTFRLPATDVAAFVDALVEGLADAVPEPPTAPVAEQRVVPHTGAIDVGRPAPHPAADDSGEMHVDWLFGADGGRASA